ncbi:hypothetical protein [Elizabethkingia ursingii]
MADKNVAPFDAVVNLINTKFTKSLNEVLANADKPATIFLLIAFGGVCVQIYRNYLRGGNVWGYVEWVPLLGFLSTYGLFVKGLITSGSDMKLDLGINISEFMVKPPTEVTTNIISLVASDITSSMKMAFAEIMISLINVIAVVGYLYVRMKVVFKAAILVFIAPINISLSFIPSLSNMWQGALMKAIEVALYIPVLSLIDWIGKQVFKEAIQPSIIKSPKDYIDAMANMQLGILFYGMIAFSYFTVPSLVAWVLDSGGGGNSGGGRKAGAMLTTLARKATIKV